MRYRVAWATVCGIAVLLALGATVLHWLDPVQLDVLTREDGVAEDAQAISYFAAGFTFLVVAARRRSNVWLWVFAVGLLFVGAEEISWGQRIFGIDTPQSMQDINRQGELNLHNVTGLHQNVRAPAFVVVLLLFVVLPIAEKHKQSVRQWRERAGVPIVPMWIAPVATAGLLLMLVPRVVDTFVIPLDESGELMTAISAFMYAVATVLQASNGPVVRLDKAYRNSDELVG